MATLTGEVVALSRQNRPIAWTAQIPAGSNALLAIVGNTLFAATTALATYVTLAGTDN